MNRAGTEMNHLSPEIVILTLLLETLACVLWLEQSCFDSSNTWYWTLKVKKNMVWFRWAFHLQKEKTAYKLSFLIISSRYFSPMIYAIILWPCNCLLFSSEHIWCNFLNLRKYNMSFGHSFLLPGNSGWGNHQMEASYYIVEMKAELGGRTCVGQGARWWQSQENLNSVYIQMSLYLCCAIPSQCRRF